MKKLLLLLPLSSIMINAGHEGHDHKIPYETWKCDFETLVKKADNEWHSGYKACKKEYGKDKWELCANAQEYPFLIAVINAAEEAHKNWVENKKGFVDRKNHEKKDKKH